MRKGLFAKVVGFTVAATLMLTPMTALASGNGSGTNTSRPSSSSSSSSSSRKSSGGSSSTSAIKNTGAVVSTADGKIVKSNVGGVFSVVSLNGAAVTTTMNDFRTAVGVSNGKIASVVMRDSKCGAAAKKCLTDTAVALGVNAGPMIDFYAMGTTANGYRTVDSLSKDVAILFGIPANMRTEGVEYFMIRVVAGGAVDILFDTDADPSTITVNTNKSGVYMLAYAPDGYLDALK